MFLFKKVTNNPFDKMVTSIKANFDISLWLMNLKFSSTNIHLRSYSKPVGVTKADLTDIPARDLMGYMNSPLICSIIIIYAQKYGLV